MARYQPTVFTSWLVGLVLRSDRSATRTLVIHTAVGTGAGLLIGLALSGAGTGDDRTSVVLTWTAVGAVAGVGSGVVTWLAGRAQ